MLSKQLTFPNYSLVWCLWYILLPSMMYDSLRNLICRFRLVCAKFICLARLEVSEQVRFMQCVCIEHSVSCSGDYWETRESWTVRQRATIGNVKRQSCLWAISELLLGLSGCLTLWRSTFAAHPSLPPFWTKPPAWIWESYSWRMLAKYFWNNGW